MNVAEEANTFGIDLWRVSARLGFEPTIINFMSYFLTNSTNRSWVQLVLAAKFEQLLQFHLLLSGKISFQQLP